MSTTETIINRQDPAIEAYRLGLLGDVQKFVADRIAAGDMPPDYQVAQLAPAELAGIQAAMQGIGAYSPYLSAGSEIIQQGQALAAGQATPALMGGLGTAQAGQAFIDEAAQLAAARRGLPFVSQEAANQMLQRGLGLGTDLGQQGIGQLMSSIGMGSEAAGTGATALRGLAGQTGAAVSGAQTGADLAAQRARASTATAQEALMRAGGMGSEAAQQGIASLAGTGQRFDPSQIAPFMGSYEDAAVQQALSDIARQGQIAQQGVRAQAVGAGAFGGSRTAIAEQELQRNILEQQGRTAAQMRAAGFESAANRAQQAFEQQMGRQQQMGALTGQLGQAGAGTAMQAAGQAGQLGLSAEGLAQTGALQGGQLNLSGIQASGQLQDRASQLALTAAAQQAGAGQNIGALGTNLGQLGLSAAGQQGQLGLQYGQLSQQDVNQLLAMSQQQGSLGQGIGSLAGQIGALGGQLGQLGIQQAGIGELQTNLGAQDVQNLITTGAVERGVAQSTADAQRLTNLQRYSQPYQQYGFLSDIYAGVPTGQMTTTASSTPQVSPFQTAVGLGISGLSAAAGAQRAGII